jgi:RNA 2',3'-cyclic 3'-phosphodiesterase
MRLFVAVHPSPEVLDAIDALPRTNNAPVRWTTRDQWHVTLCFFGDVDSPVLIVDALRDALRDVGPVRVTVGPRAGRFGRQIVHLPVHGLEALAATVVAATRSFGAPPDGRAFRGHLTLARTRGRRIDTSALDLAGEWTVAAVDLVRSHLGPHGARYETLERFGLSGESRH